MQEAKEPDVLNAVEVTAVYPGVFGKGSGKRTHVLFEPFHVALVKFHVHGKQDQQGHGARPDIDGAAVVEL